MVATFHRYLTRYVLAAFGLLTLTTTAVGQSACFHSLFDYSFAGPTQGRVMINGDFDEDGFLDVIVGQSQTSANNMRFIKGLGNGKFAAPVTFDAGQRPTGVVAYDFNGDSHLDLGVTNNNIAQISILNGTGTGSFGVPTTYSLTPFMASLPYGIDKGDFNNDGKMDLVVASGTSGFFLMTASATPGTFALSGPFSMQTSPRGIVAGDFNGNGNLDVAVVNFTNNSVSIRFGDGAGNFAAASHYPLPGGSTGPVNITSGDFNGDSFVDLATSNTTSSNMTVLLNNGSGAFASATSYPARSGPNTIHTADFNEDTELDIMMINEADNTVSYYSGTGTGTFNTQVLFPAVGTPKAMTYGYFDADTHLDVVYGSEIIATSQPSLFGMISIMIGTGTGNFNTIQPWDVGTTPVGIAVADFDEDGKNDFVTANNGSSNFSLLTGVGNGTFNAAVNFSTVSAPTSICVGDFNGDAHADVVTCNEAGGTDDVMIRLGNGAGSFGGVTSFATVSNPVKVVAYDVNVDGDLDLVVVGQGGGGLIGIMLGNGAGSFAGPSTVATGGTPTSVALGKFNADGIPDMVYTMSAATNNVALRMGSGGGAFGVASTFSAGNSPADIVAADFNSDGFFDVATANNLANNVSVLRNNGSGSLVTPAVNYLANTNPLSITSGDFNQDGHIDIATSSMLAGNCAGVVDVYMNSGNATATFTFMETFAGRINPKQLVSADFTADNMPDLVLANSISNQASILINTTPYITALGPTLFCGGGSVTLQSSLANTYTWSPSGGTAQTANITTTGIYTVTTNSSFSNWCTSTSAGDTITSAPLPAVDGVTGTLTICTGTATTLTATSGAASPTFNWYNAPTGGTLLQTGAVYNTPSLVTTTSYWVEVTDGTTTCTSSPRFQVTVVVQDVTPPVISSMPSNLTLNAGASCTAVGTWSSPSATDNCTLISCTPDIPSGSTFPLGTTVVTYTATDAASNTSTATFNVTVVDVTNPVITGMPANVTQPNTAGQCCRVVTWTAPSASDNCSVTSFTSSHTSGTCFPVGVTTVTYTASDAAGHVVNSSFTITINDTQLPTITGTPANINTTVTAGSCCKVVTWTAPSAADNCSVASFTSSHTSGACFPVGVTTVTYTATDVNGNVATSSFTVTVVDNLNPTFTGTPANITQNAVNGGCFRSVTWTAPTANDNCPGFNVVASHTSPFSFPVGVTTVTYTATDASGNTAVTSFTVTIVDNQNPYYTAFPSNINTVCGAGLCTATVSWTAPTSADNCSVQGQTSTHNSGASFPVGVTTVTYTLTDVNGNTHNQSFTVTVTDNIPPSVTGCPTTITVCEGQTVNCTPPTGSDNCPGVTVTQTAGLPCGSVFPVGTTLCTYKVQDASGNFVNCNFNVIVNPAPAASLALTDDTHCLNGAIYTLAGGSPAGGSYSGPGVSGGNFNPATAGVGSHTITYTYTGTNGCQDVVTDIINVASCPGINENEKETLLLNVYPNPNKGDFTIEIPVGYENATLHVMNATGQIIRTWNGSLSGKTQVSLGEVQRGMYMLVLTSATNGRPYTARIIVD